MLDSYAARVRFVRSLTKLSREELEKRYGINRNTLKSWELSINTLTEKSAKALSDAINQEGFSCSPQWLIFGQGAEPRATSKGDDELLLTEISQQSRAIYEADYFKNNNLNSIVCMITDKSMSPQFNLGDYVGGININFNKNINSLIGRPCIITMKNNTITVRKILLGEKKHIVLCPENIEHEADIKKNEDIISIANIIWHRAIFTDPLNDD